MAVLIKDVFCGKKALVTGHTGFKGSWLSLWLSELGAELTGLSVDIPTVPSHFESLGLSTHLKDVRLDIAEGEAVKSLVRDVQPDFVFHLAAQPLVRRSYSDPAHTWRTNTLGTVNVLEALRGLEKPCVATLITSDKCYDNVEWVWGYRENDALGGPDPYSASKGAAELAIRSYVRSFFAKNGAVRVGVGRAGNVIGGGDWAEDRIVPDCVRAWARGEKACIRNPAATRPWQHVLEPLSGYLCLAAALFESDALHGEPFNFGPPAHQDHSVRELVEGMSAHWKAVRWEDVSPRTDGPHECGLLKLNCDKALHHLQWRAIWDFGVSVRETALWYRKYYEKKDKSMRDFSLRQIADYTACARQQGLAWAH